jgi:chemotaxis protein MotB
MSDAWDAPMKPPRYTAVKVAILTTIAAGGAGYYAWHLRGKHAESSKGWTENKAAYDVCAKELDSVKKTQGDLGSQLATTAADRERDKIAREASEKALTQMQTDLQATRVELEDLRKQRVETEKRLAAFKELTAKFQKMIDSGRLQVVIRDGRMIVKLPAAVLFPSGKADLAREGELALMEVGIILKQIPDRSFMVAGHTDNVPLKGSTYKNNWELSTARAVRVTEFLISVGMKPDKIAAAGYAEFDPVKSNKTDAGKQENRRIEIVLLPKIEEMPPMPVEKPPEKAAEKAPEKAPEKPEGGGGVAEKK